MAGDMNPTPEANAGAPDASGAPAAAPKPEKKEKAPPTMLVIRGYSKMVYFWPIVLVSLTFYFLSGGWWYEHGADSTVEGTGALIEIQGLTVWWMLIFMLNLLVFVMDFGRSNFLAVFTSIGVVVLGLTAYGLGTDTQVWNGIYGFFNELDVTVTSNFYLCMFVIFGFYLALAFLFARFNYWELSSNELVHKHGLLGDVRRYPTMHLYVEKEIPDIFEWVLTGGGRLLFKPGGVDHKRNDDLIVENVFFINRAERKIKDFLQKIDVK